MKRKGGIKRKGSLKRKNSDNSVLDKIIYVVIIFPVIFAMIITNIYLISLLKDKGSIGEIKNLEENLSVAYKVLFIYNLIAFFACFFIAIFIIIPSKKENKSSEKIFLSMKENSKTLIRSIMILTELVITLLYEMLKSAIQLLKRNIKKTDNTEVEVNKKTTIKELASLTEEEKEELETIKIYIKKYKKILIKTTFIILGINVILCLVLVTIKLTNLAKPTNTEDLILLLLLLTITFFIIIGTMFMKSLYDDTQKIEYMKDKVNDYIDTTKKIMLVLVTFNAIILLFLNLK